LKYAYRLRRESGPWILTLPIAFHFPDAPLKNRLDITEELALQLGLKTTAGSAAGNPLPCDKGNEVMSTEKKHGQLLVDVGYVSPVRAVQVWEMHLRELPGHRANLLQGRSVQKWILQQYRPVPMHAGLELLVKSVLRQGRPIRRGPQRLRGQGWRVRQVRRRQPVRVRALQAREVYH
jgi:hypothetical protein